MDHTERSGAAVKKLLIILATTVALVGPAHVTARAASLEASMENDYCYATYDELAAQRMCFERYGSAVYDCKEQAKRSRGQFNMVRCLRKFEKKDTMDSLVIDESDDPPVWNRKP
jgi:hypothetical protein